MAMQSRAFASPTKSKGLYCSMLYNQMTEIPFELERNPKKFLQHLEQERGLKQAEKTDEERKKERLDKLYDKGDRCGLLARLEDQTNKLKQERDEMFAREAKSKNPNKQPDIVAQHLKHFNPKLLEHKEADNQKKNYRIRAILREKRETLIDFIERKRQICLANLNILTKKEETNRLEDFIKNEQESLRARKLYFKNDCELVKKFMNEVKAQADLATQIADKEAKKKDEIKSEVAKILATTDRLKLQKTKFQEEYERLDKYRQFLEKIQENHKKKFSEFTIGAVSAGQGEGQQVAGQPFFVTGVDINSVESGKPTEQQKQAEAMLDKMANVVIEILNTIEEGNLRNIQNQRDNEEEIEQKRRELESLERLLAQQKKENQDRLRVLQKQYDMDEEYQKQLMKQGKVDQTKLQFAEGEDLDMEKTGRKILEIWYDCLRKEPDEGKKVQIDSKLLKSLMNNIEKALIELMEQRYQIYLKTCNINDKEKGANEKKNDKKFDKKGGDQVQKSEPQIGKEKEKSYAEIEKQVKTKKKELRLKNQKDDEKKNLVEERRNKKNEYLKNFYKGRHDMRRHYQQEKVVVEEVVQETDVNDDDKYLLEEYELGQERQEAQKTVAKLNVNQSTNGDLQHKG